MGAQYNAAACRRIRQKGRLAMRYVNARLAGLIALGIGVISCGWLISGPLTSHAVQNPSISLDMVTTGNTYCDGTGTDNLGNPCSPNNSMTVGTIDNCLTSAVANTATHNHVAQLIVQNVEDLIGWQARMNYIGDKMRPLGFNGAPFADGGTG